MDIKNILELPQRIIKSNIEKIDVIGYEKVNKVIKITTNDEKETKCIATTTSSIIHFNQVEFETDFELELTIDLTGFKAEDKINTEIKIISQNNDLVIPIKIKVSTPFLEVENKKLYNLNDFNEYLKEDGYNATKLFATENFKSWIKYLDEKYILSYNMFFDDDNIKRRIENFLIVNGVKDAVKLFFNKPIEKNFICVRDKKIEGFIEINKKGNGYFEYDLIKHNNCDLIKFEQDKITSDNFMDSNKYKLKYILELDENKKIDEIKEKISFENNLEILELQFYKMPMIKLNISKDLYKNGEIGFFEIENNVGFNINVEIKSDDIELKKNRYNFSKKQKVMFKVDKKVVDKIPSAYGLVDILAFCDDMQEKKQIKFKIDLT